MARSTYEDFIIKEKIGSGSYGVVFKVIRKVDKMTYAMKEIDLQGMSRKEQEECIRETRVLSSLDSDFIIKYYDSFLERGKLYIITEHASNGNLHDYIKKQKTRLPEELIWKLFVQILLGLHHMHSRKILHRDIKTLNVFLDDDLNVKLGDMGVAKILSTQTNFAKTIVGTPYYLSPELCEDKPYNEKSDVWALGVVLYECCTQRHPFDADNQGALILKILRGKYPPVSGYSPDVADIIKRCLTQNANRRPNTHKLLLLPTIRLKAEEAKVLLPDQHTLMAALERAKAKSSGGGAARPAQPQQEPASESAAAAQAVRDLPGPYPAAQSSAPGQPQGGVIHVVGNMEHSASQELAWQQQPSASGADNADKAFVFGGTVRAGSRAQALDVSVSGVESTPGDLAEDGLLSPSGADAGAAASPLEADWRVTGQGEAGTSGQSSGPRVQAWGAGSSGGGALTPDSATRAMGGLGLEDEEEGEGEEEEDDTNNIYNNPRAYRDPNDPEDLDEEEDEDEDGDEEYDENVGADHEEEEYGDEEEYDEAAHNSGAWQPDPVRMNHMRSAAMIHREACLGLIGEEAFDKLYQLLKSNQVDEASMTDLSRLVFQIIPYDKSEVIQMMYKLLYLESQIETA